MRDNYSFKKRAKELARKKKQDEKKQRRLDKKNAVPSENLPGDAAGLKPTPINPPESSGGNVCI